MSFVQIYLKPAFQRNAQQVCLKKYQISTSILAKIKLFPIYVSTQYFKEWAVGSVWGRYLSIEVQCAHQTIPYYNQNFGIRAIGIISGVKPGQHSNGREYCISNPISLKHSPSSQHDQFLMNFDNILQINVFLCMYLKAGVGKYCLRETLY